MDAELVTAITRARQLRGHSSRTLEADLFTLRHLGVHPAEATIDDITRFVMRVKTPNSRFTYATWVRSLFQLLRDEKLIPRNHRPDVDLPRLRKPAGRPKPFTVDQLARLRREAVHPFADVITVAALTGLRCAELWALRGADLVDGVHGPEIEVVGKGNKAAVIPAHPTVVQVIESYRTLGPLWQESRWQDAHSFGGAVNGEIKRVLGFGSMHQCRHAFGTQVLDATGDVTIAQKLLRHASPATTMVYCQVADRKTRAAVELLAG